MSLHMRLLLVFLIFLAAVMSVSAGQPASHLALTLPDAGEYSTWVQSKAGSVSVLPTTVMGKKQVSVDKSLAPGDTLYALDAHTGQVAAHVLEADPKGGLKAIALIVSDFKPNNAPLPPPPPSPVFPANGTSGAKTESTVGSGIGRFFTWLLGLIVAVGVGWVIWQLYKTRGAPLLTLARRFGIEVPDPTPINAEADVPAPVYAPPAPHAIEKIPDEAGIAPPPIPAGGIPARRVSSPSTSLSDVPQLVGIQGLAAGSIFALSDGEVTIGRDGDNQIVLAENTVSRRHARVTHDPPGRISIADAGSANGIYINGERVSQAILNPGDEIKIGDNYFRFEG